MYLRPDGGPMVGPEQQDTIMNVTSALFLGGGDTVRSSVCCLIVPICDVPFVDGISHDLTILCYGQPSGSNEEGTSRVGLSCWVGSSTANGWYEKFTLYWGNHQRGIAMAPTSANWHSSSNIGGRRLRKLSHSEGYYCDSKSLVSQISTYETGKWQISGFKEYHQGSRDIH